MDDGYMIMVCTKNGSLVREKYKALYGGWEEFNQLISYARPAKYCGIFLEHPEITPPINVSSFMEC